MSEEKTVQQPASPEQAHADNRTAELPEQALDTVAGGSTYNTTRSNIRASKSVATES